MDTEQQALAAIEKHAGGPVPCGWFALCENTATTTAPHPILGWIPVCQRCAERISNDNERSTD